MYHDETKYNVKHKISFWQYNLSLLTTCFCILILLSITEVILFSYWSDVCWCVGGPGANYAGVLVALEHWLSVGWLLLLYNNTMVRTKGSFKLSWACGRQKIALTDH